MITQRWQYLVCSLIIGGMLLAGLFLLLLPGIRLTVQADSNTLFVKPDGTGVVCSRSDPCALQEAIRKAKDGDAIYLAGGTYTGTGAAVVTLTESVALYGGWDGKAEGRVMRDPTIYPTVLDGERLRRVVYISGDITPTLDGLIITRGNATGILTDTCPVIGGKADGCGGGIFVHQAHPIIINNIITNNIAAISTQGYPTSTTGYGGGIYLYSTERAVISGNMIISNVASTANAGMGGGICLDGTTPGLMVQGNRILNNVAGKTQGWGGGIGGEPNGARIQNNLIQGNRAMASSPAGYGGGLYQWHGSAEYRNNLIRGNHGQHAVYLGHSRSVFWGNLVVDNATEVGVYLAYGSKSQNGPLLANNAIVIRNATTLYTLRTYATKSSPLTATLIHNTLVGNRNSSGVYIDSGYVTLFLTNTIVASHSWGITNTQPTSSTVYADYTLFWANSHNGIVGNNPVFNDPRFLRDGYHLGPGSAAIDVGALTNITTDIDGDRRPVLTAPDIGADERLIEAYLPLVLRNYP